jgi:hypothetical protein
MAMPACWWARPPPVSAHTGGHGNPRARERAYYCPMIQSNAYMIRPPWGYRLMRS